MDKLWEAGLRVISYDLIGDLTEKGYTKKLKALVAPHLQKSEYLSSFIMHTDLIIFVASQYLDMAYNIW